LTPTTHFMNPFNTTAVDTGHLRHPGWYLAVDQDPQMAEAARRRILDRAAADRTRCVGYHWPFPANGYVVKDGDGYRLVPADWSGQV
jgi:hypothetical protein